MLSTGQVCVALERSFAQARHQLRLAGAGSEHASDGAFEHVADLAGIEMTEPAPAESACRGAQQCRSTL